MFPTRKIKCRPGAGARPRLRAEPPRSVHPRRHPGHQLAMPHILGSGHRRRGGGGRRTLRACQAGLARAAAPGVSCRQCEQCLSGKDNFCRKYTLFGAGIDGGNAELMAAPEYAVIPIPDDLAVRTGRRRAAGLPHRVAHADGARPPAARRGRAGAGRFERRGHGRHPDREAVPVPRDRHRGRRGETGQSARTRRRSRDRPLRAGHRRRSRRITGKRGVDVVFEHVGAATWQKSLDSLAAGGRLVTCGATTGYDARVDLRYLFSKQWSLLGSFMGSLGELHQVLKFVFRGQFKPVIDRVYPLAEIRAAHERLEARQQFGKIRGSPVSLKSNMRFHVLLSALAPFAVSLSGRRASALPAIQTGSRPTDRRRARRHRGLRPPCVPLLPDRQPPERLGFPQQAIDWSAEQMRAVGLSNVRVLPVEGSALGEGRRIGAHADASDKPLHMLGLGMSVGRPEGALRRMWWRSPISPNSTSWANRECRARSCSTTKSIAVTARRACTGPPGRRAPRRSELWPRWCARSRLSPCRFPIPVD